MFKLCHFDRCEEVNPLSKDGSEEEAAWTDTEIGESLVEGEVTAVELPVFVDATAVCVGEAGDNSVPVVRVEPCPCRFHRRESVLRMKAQAIMLMPMAEPKCSSG